MRQCVINPKRCTTDRAAAGPKTSPSLKCQKKAAARELKESDDGRHATIDATMIEIKLASKAQNMPKGWTPSTRAIGRFKNQFKIEKVVVVNTSKAARKVILIKVTSS